MSEEILRKLGYKPGMTGYCHKVPDQLASMFDAVSRTPAPGGQSAQWYIWFVDSAQALEECAALANQAYVTGRHLWFAYPKRSGKIKADITRDRGWSALTPFELLPVTQIAQDADWSVLRFRRRAEIKKLTRAF